MSDTAPAPTKTQAHRRSLEWLKSCGVTSTGKKGKRIVHRRERHLARKHLQTTLQTSI